MSLHEKEGNKKNLHQADNPSLHLLLVLLYLNDNADQMYCACERVLVRSFGGTYDTSGHIDISP